MSRAARAAAPLPSRVLAGILLVAWAASPTHAQEVIEYYGTDALGSIRVVFDASGTVVARTDYLPFGETFEASGNGPAEGFTGQARDGEAGLDYFHARMYQPRTGRFNGVDPVYAGLFDPQQWNRYAYARNNPLSFVDPSGLALQCVSGEELVYVDVESGAGGGRRDSVPILWNYVTCAEYGETTPDPLKPNPPTDPGRPHGPIGPVRSQGPGPGAEPETTPEEGEEPKKPLHCHPGFIEHSEKAWIRAALGTIQPEAVFWVLGSDANPTFQPGPFTNEYRKATVPIPPGRIAFVHTHPNGTNPRPSAVDRRSANGMREPKIPFYTISRGGLWVYHPGASRSEMLRPNLEWLKPCGN